MHDKSYLYFHIYIVIFKKWAKFKIILLIDCEMFIAYVQILTLFSMQQMQWIIFEVQ